MKKLLLILLCLPMIGFGQDNCGEEPKVPKSTKKLSKFKFKQTKEYKQYLNRYYTWSVCSGTDRYKFSNIDLITYDMLSSDKFIQETNSQKTRNKYSFLILLSFPFI